MGEDKIGHHPVFFYGEGISIRSPLNVGRLPVPGPVPVWIVIAVAVFVDPSIPVVVDPLGAQDGILPLFPFLDSHEKVRKLPVALPFSVWIAHPHLGDVPVAVEVVRPVFVGDGALAAPGGMGRVRLVHVGVAGIGAQHRDEVKNPFPEQARYEIVPAVHLQQVPRGVEDHFGSLQLVRVDSAVDIEGGLVFGSSLGDGEDPHVPFAVGLSQALEAAPFRMLCGQFPEYLRRIAVVMVPVPLNGDLRVGRRAHRLVGLFVLDESGEEQGEEGKRHRDLILSVQTKSKRIQPRGCGHGG